MPAPHERRAFLGVTFDILGEDEALDAVLAAARSPEFRFVVTPNVDHVVHLHDAATSGSAIERSYRQAWLTLCDSRILALLARWSGVILPVVAGSDLTARLLPDPRFAGLHCLVVGGSPETMARLRQRFPQYRWSQFIPPPGVLHDAAAQQSIVEAVTETAADLVFMAFGFPQSERVCAMVRESGRARGVALCIGASLEFVTGEKRRAPLAFQQLRLEWLYRLLTEPRRLWRRYLVVGPRIFAIWARARR